MGVRRGVVVYCGVFEFSDSGSGGALDGNRRIESHSGDFVDTNGTRHYSDLVSLRNRTMACSSIQFDETLLRIDLENSLNVFDKFYYFLS